MLWQNMSFSPEMIWNRSAEIDKDGFVFNPEMGAFDSPDKDKPRQECFILFNKYVVTSLMCI